MASTGGSARRSRGVVAVILLTLSLAAACTERQGGDPELAPLPTSTTLAESGNLSTTTVDDSPAKPIGSSPEKIRAEFDRVVAARDFCGLLETVDATLPDVEDRAAVVETYRKVADSVEAATSFVPPELTTAWVVVVDSSRRAAVAAERAQGDLNDPSISGAFEQVLVELDLWQDENCA